MAKKRAKKKVSRKKVSKKKVKKKSSRKVVKKKSVSKKVVKKKVVQPGLHPNKQSRVYNSRLALRDLVVFAFLSLLSLFLYLVSGNLFYDNLFYLLAMVFGFIAIAFLIVYLALAFSKERKR